MEGLRRSLCELARSSGEDLAWFADQIEDAPLKNVQSRNLPMCDLLPEILVHSGKATSNVVSELLGVRRGLRWQQSYSEEDGFTREYLDAYGWVNFASPEGIYLSETVRVTIGYWGAGLQYREHNHVPEEFYVVLAGNAIFHSEGRSPRACGPGDVVHHKPYQNHSIDMSPGPLLAAAFWRGDDLLAKSDLG